MGPTSSSRLRISISAWIPRVPATGDWMPEEAVRWSCEPPRCPGEFSHAPDLLSQAGVDSWVGPGGGLYSSPQSPAHSWEAEVDPDESSLTVDSFFGTPMPLFASVQ